MTLVFKGIVQYVSTTYKPVFEIEAQLHNYFQLKFMSIWLTTIRYQWLLYFRGENFGFVGPRVKDLKTETVNIFVICKISKPEFESFPCHMICSGVKIRFSKDDHSNIRVEIYLARFGACQPAVIKVRKCDFLIDFFFILSEKWIRMPGDNPPWRADSFYSSLPS